MNLDKRAEHRRELMKNEMWRETRKFSRKGDIGELSQKSMYVPGNKSVEIGCCKNNILIGRQSTSYSVLCYLDI